MSGPASPPVTAETQPFWDAVAQGKLMLNFCEACDRFQWPPVTFCSRCNSKVIWKAASGYGRVETFTAVHRPPSKTNSPSEPYVLAFIQLDEGVRFFSRIVGCNAASIALDMRVQVRFEQLDGAGQVLPVFAPT